MDEQSEQRSGRKICKKCQCSWKPTSATRHETAEQNVLRHVKSKIVGKYVDIGDNLNLWTLEVTGEREDNVPLVLIHGFGSGVGLWAKNYDVLAKKQKVYAFDVLGFARSSRPTFPEDAHEAEELLAKSVENWRKAMNLQKFNLLGHSFGGFIAFAYAFRYPQHVNHLILADPWGVGEKPPDVELSNFPRWVRFVYRVVSAFNPFAGVRAAGPWGPAVVKRIRGDIQRKFDDMFGEDDDSVTEYLYHCNAQTPSGEIAIKNMSVLFAWAKNPMVHKIEELDPNLPITFIFGGQSWMSNGSVSSVKEKRADSYVEIKLIEGAGHHVYVDDVDIFNQYVLEICAE